MRILISMILLLLSESVHAQVLDYSNRGYLKQLSNISLNDNTNEVNYDNIIQFRIENTIQIAPFFRLNADLRARYFTGHTVRNMPIYGEMLDVDNGYIDLNRNLIQSHNMILNTMIDRMHLNYTMNDWEITLGRQRLNWGKTTVWNPNDLFNTYSFLDFDYEERPGTDALHLLYSWGFASSLELGVKLVDTFSNNVIAAMYRSNFKTFDFQLIIGKYEERYTLGGGWSGYLGNAGFKGEISYFMPLKTSGYTFISSVGADYMFSNGIFGSAELLFNSTDDEGRDLLLLETPSATNIFISDTGYFLNFSRTPNPLSNFSLGVLGSFTDRIMILIPQAGFSLSEEIDLLVLMQSYRGGWFDARIATKNLLYLRFKWSF
jgi:hypothetical protein